MPTDFSDKTACVVDSGLFPWLAVTLAKSFDRVLYFVPWQCAFPTRNQLNIGHGLPGVHSVDSWEEYVDDVDLWVFPDIHYAETALILEKMGKRVWSSRRGEVLETDRRKSKQMLNKAGLSVGEYEVVKGIADLREYLKTHRDVWVKSDRTRGDFETFHSDEYKLVEPMLDRIEHNLSQDADETNFVVEKSIPDAVEVGLDLYSVDGRFPGRGLVGIENKAKAYLGHFVSEEQMPRMLVEQNRLVAPMLEKWRYRNFFCLESRITKDGTAWALDPATRFGSPPSELELVMYSNLAEIMWNGAEGVLVDPVPAGKYGAELIIYSSFAETDMQAVFFPEELTPNIALRYASRSKGTYYVRPQPAKLSHVGSVSAVGDTVDDAIKNCTDYADQIKGFGIEYFPAAFDEIKKDIKQLNQFEIRF